MNPENLLELTSAFVDGELTLEESRAFESNLPLSSELSEELQGVTAVRDLLRANGQEVIPAGMLNFIIAVVGASDEGADGAASDDYPTEIAHGVIEIIESPTTKRRLAKWLAGTAAAACLLVVIGVPSSGSVAPPIAASVQTHAARSSLDEPAVEKLSAASISAGFLR